MRPTLTTGIPWLCWRLQAFPQTISLNHRSILKKVQPISYMSTSRLKRKISSTTTEARAKFARWGAGPGRTHTDRSSEAILGGTPISSIYISRLIRF